MKLPKPQYTTEFKELALQQFRDGQSEGAVAKELGLIEQTLRDGSRPPKLGCSKEFMSKWSHRSRWNV
jgi:transposase